MRYERIYMDADDTLFDFQTGNRRAVNQLMHELGLDDPADAQDYHAINHDCWLALERGEMTQEVLHVERFRRFLSLKNRTDAPERVADRFAQLLGSQSILLPHAQELIDAVSAERPVIILTNGITPIQKARLNGSSIKNQISRMIISQEVGVSKPDPRIFTLALDGLDPKKALMIGDSPASDILAANRAGVDVCWYNPNHRILTENMHAEYEVQDLLQCIPIALKED